MKTTYVVIIAIAITAIFFHLAAGASERHEHHDHQTINTIIKNDRFTEGFAKGVGVAVVTACGIWPATKSFIWPATVALFTASKPKWNSWVNCWEPDKKEPLPNPGPVLKITPDVPTGVRLYQ